MARGSVTELCEIASERGLMVDMHCDETDDPMSRHIEQLAYETQRLGLQGRVAGVASHLDAFDGQLLCLQAAAADRGSRSGGVPNPLINITLQGVTTPIRSAAA
jgi:cytosine deaminase